MGREKNASKRDFKIHIGECNVYRKSEGKCGKKTKGVE